MSNEIQTHTNENEIEYYSKKNETGEMIYSFNVDFEDYWDQATQDLYGQNTPIK